VLKLYVVVNDIHLYQLKEQEPLILDEHELPVKLVAKNGFHFSKAKYITQHAENPVLIGIGCRADNGTLWGGILFSLLFFIVFFISGIYLILLLANLPLLYLVYKFFIKPTEFITIEILKK
jgi:hypothetical protein